MCRVLDVARSWFHAWQRAAPQRAERAARREDLVGQVRKVFEASKQRYGAPRIHAELRDRGRGVSKRTIAKLMPDTVWLADISYVPTDEGWLYLAAVKDLATMEIVGWSMPRAS